MKTLNFATAKIRNLNLTRSAPRPTSGAQSLRNRLRQAGSGWIGSYSRCGSGIGSTPSTVAGKDPLAVPLKCGHSVRGRGVRKGSVIVALAVSVLVGIGTAGAGASGTAPAKKRCHFVKKKVHGKIKRVRVCTKPKPKPKPAKVKNLIAALDDVAFSDRAVECGRRDASRATRAGPRCSSRSGRSAREDTAIAISRVAACVGSRQGVEARRGGSVRAGGLALEQPATLVIEAKRRGERDRLVRARPGAHRAIRRQRRRTVGPDERHAFLGRRRGARRRSTSFHDATAALTRGSRAESARLLRRAGRTTADLGEAFEAAFAWEREVELLGLGSRVPHGARRDLERAREVASRRAMLPHGEALQEPRPDDS